MFCLLHVPDEFIEVKFAGPDHEVEDTLVIRCAQFRPGRLAPAIPEALVVTIAVPHRSR